MSPEAIRTIIDRAVIIARCRGLQDPREELRRQLAELLFAELRAERRLASRPW